MAHPKEYVRQRPMVALGVMLALVVMVIVFAALWMSARKEHNAPGVIGQRSLTEHMSLGSGETGGYRVERTDNMVSGREAPVFWGPNVDSRGDLAAYYGGKTTVQSAAQLAANAARAAQMGVRERQSNRQDYYREHQTNNNPVLTDSPLATYGAGHTAARAPSSQGPDGSFWRSGESSSEAQNRYTQAMYGH